MSRERKRSQIEDVEDFAESLTTDVGDVVDYLISKNAEINATDIYGIFSKIVT